MFRITGQLKALIIGYYDKMFNNKPNDPRDEVTHVLNGMLKKITRRVPESPYILIFLEQNPMKLSSYGVRAKNGHNIMWVILRNEAMKKETWIGHVEDRVWKAK